MTTLTATELTDVRMVVGDNASPYRLSDTILQTLHTSAETDAPDSTLILPYTYVYALRRLWGLSRLEVDRVNELAGDRVLHSQIKQTSKDLLDYWEGVAGLSGGGILSAGVIDLDLDEDE
jgi:hypothetical protein